MTEATATEDGEKKQSLDNGTTSTRSDSTVSTTTAASQSSRRPSHLERGVSTRSHEQSVICRTNTALSVLRQRQPVQRFTHTLSHTKTGSDVIVDFDGPDDPYKPLNWPFKKKVVTTVLYGLTTMGATWASSVYSPAVRPVAQHFHVGQEVSILGISLLLIGFGLGPLIWAPLSEVYGRKGAVLIPYFIAGIFSFGTATAKDIQTVLITRFFAGFFGSAPVTNTGGVLGDIWPAQSRGVAIVGYAMAVVGGPTLGKPLLKVILSTHITDGDKGPIAGGAIVQSYLGWRWTEYVSAIIVKARDCLTEKFCRSPES
jgi:hypothetical protein